MTAREQLEDGQPSNTAVLEGMQRDLELVWLRAFAGLTRNDMGIASAIKVSRDGVALFLDVLVKRM